MGLVESGLPDTCFLSPRYRIEWIAFIDYKCSCVILLRSSDKRLLIEGRKLYDNLSSPQSIVNNAGKTAVSWTKISSN